MMIHPFTGLKQNCHYIVVSKDGKYVGTKKLYSMKEVKAAISFHNYMDTRTGAPITEYTWRLIEE